jgi:uncharacterized protein (TIGR02996 family)
VPVSEGALVTDLADLVRGSLANPADLAPRLALCDYLEERDDPRGRALRASMSLPDANLDGGTHSDPWSYGPFHVRRLAARLSLVAWGRRTDRRTGQWKLPPVYFTACELSACRLLTPAERDGAIGLEFVRWFGPKFRRNLYPLSKWTGLREPEIVRGLSPNGYISPYGTSLISAAMLMRSAGRCQNPFGQVWVPYDSQRQARRLLEIANERLGEAICELVVKGFRRVWSCERFISLPNGRKARVPA